MKYGYLGGNWKSRFSRFFLNLKPRNVHFLLFLGKIKKARWILNEIFLFSFARNALGVSCEPSGDILAGPFAFSEYPQEFPPQWSLLLSFKNFWYSIFFICYFSIFFGWNFCSRFKIWTQNIEIKISFKKLKVESWEHFWLSSCCELVK